MAGVSFPSDVQQKDVFLGSKMDCRHRLRHREDGVALADPELKIASPYENYNRRNPAADAKYFCRLARDDSIQRFVVGLPVHLDGRESQKLREARATALGWPPPRRCRSNISMSGLPRPRPSSTC